MKESFSLGGLRVFIIMTVRLVFINVLVSYVFSISLELVSLKFMIYLIILLYLVIKFSSKFFYKWWVYEKRVLIFELFNLYYYRVEIYAYRVLNEVVQLFSSLRAVKNILLVN